MSRLNGILRQRQSFRPEGVRPKRRPTATERRLEEIAELVSNTLLNASASGADVRVDASRESVIIRDCSYWPDEFSQFLRSKHSVRVDTHTAGFDDGGGFIIIIRLQRSFNSLLLFGLCILLIALFAFVLGLQWHVYSENIKSDHASGSGGFGSGAGAGSGSGATDDFDDSDADAGAGTYEAPANAANPIVNAVLRALLTDGNDSSQ